jgi:hypothetical protein
MEGRFLKEGFFLRFATLKRREDKQTRLVPIYSKYAASKKVRLATS